MLQLNKYKVSYMVTQYPEKYKSIFEDNNILTQTFVASNEEKIVQQLINDHKKEELEIVIKDVEKLEHSISKLQEWAITNEPKKEMIYYKGYWDQIIFIRDRIPSLLARSVPNVYSNKGHKLYDEIKESLSVINTHMSKSILLPVYYTECKNTKIILRDNFYNWKVSVISDIPVEHNFNGLIDEDETINPIYCEGFPEELVFGRYKNNDGKFTVEIGDNYNLYTFLFGLKCWIDLPNYMKTFGERK